VKTISELSNEFHREETLLLRRLKAVKPLAQACGAASFEFYDLRDNDELLSEVVRRFKAKGMRVKWNTKTRRLDLFPASLAFFILNQ